MIAARLLAFCATLRKNGVRAAEQEVLDAFRALTALGYAALLERGALLAVLLATLAKSASEEDVVARVFALHFDFDVDRSPAPDLARLLRERGLADADVDAVLQDLADADDALLAALAAGDAERIGELVRAALDDTDLEGLQSPLQIAYFTSRLMMRLGAPGVEERLLRARGQRAPAASSAAAWELLERLRRSARRAVETELEKRTVAKPAQRGALLDRDLRAISDPKELAELRRLVRRLAEKWKARLLVRRKRSRRGGRIDVRRVLRSSVATDGVPMKVHLQRRRPQKPDVWILCDVSDSVRQASLFMLELVAALSDVLRRSRSFVFIDRIGEVTELFSSRNASGTDRAVASVLAGDIVPVGQNSDYGRAFKELHARHAGEITRRTTIVILGDGRNNYRPPEDWVLDELRKRSRRILWLCPEDRPTWGFGDSEMIRYARHADAIFVVRSAADLARAVDRIAR